MHQHAESIPAEVKVQLDPLRAKYLEDCEFEEEEEAALRRHIRVEDTARHLRAILHSFPFALLIMIAEFANGRGPAPRVRR
jgi:hypothetical protein